jgi:hypothetical protein
MAARTSTRSWNANRFAPILVIAMASGCAGGAAQTAAIRAPMLSIGSPEVRDALLTSCGDCHADKPARAWSAKVSPSYEFGRGDALVALNFSKWDQYSEKTRETDKGLIAKVIRDNSMPPFDYRMLHPGVKLSPEQKQAVLQWASSGAGAQRSRR